MKAIEIINKIENFCPVELAEPWDNVGLLCGDINRDIKNIFLTLDANLSTVKEAVKKKADMIISHHPILFSPVNRIDYSTPTGEMIKLLIENNIVLYTAHTNMDVANGGINDVLADMFHLSDIKTVDDETNLGRIGTLKNEMTLFEFSKIVGGKLNTAVRICGNMDKIISKVAVGSGACMDEISETAYLKGADVLVTADVKYHDAIDSVERGLSIIDAGHYPTEIIVVDIFKNILKDFDLKFIKSENKDIFYTLNS